MTLSIRAELVRALHDKVEDRCEPRPVHRFDGFDPKTLVMHNAAPWQQVVKAGKAGRIGTVEKAFGVASSEADSRLASTKVARTGVAVQPYLTPSTNRCASGRRNPSG